MNYETLWVDEANSDLNDLQLDGWVIKHMDSGVWFFKNEITDMVVVPPVWLRQLFENTIAEVRGHQRHKLMSILTGVEPEPAKQLPELLSI